MCVCVSRRIVVLDLVIGKIVPSCVHACVCGAHVKKNNCVLYMFSSTKFTRKHTFLNRFTKKTMLWGIRLPNAQPQHQTGASARIESYFTRDMGTRKAKICSRYIKVYYV